MKENPQLIKIISILIVIIAVGLPFYCGHKNGREYRAEILKKPIIHNASLTAIKKVYKHSDEFIYEFYDTENHLIVSSSGSKMYYHSNVYNKIIGKSFPVIASKNNPEKFSSILICKEDFEEFDMPFPDSLGWVEKLIE